MLVPRKSRYALRAVFELAKRDGQGPVNMAQIAEAQAIPPRFLEVILGQLKQAGITASQRGKHGGYSLARRPDELAVGDVIRVVQGPVEVVECTGDQAADDCELSGDCVFLPMWEELRKAIATVYDSITFQDLVEREEQMTEARGSDWVI